MATPTSVVLGSNGKYWQAWYYDQHGRRRAKSLGSKKDISKRQAGKMCDRLAMEIQAKPQLLSGNQAPRLGEFLERYLRQRTDLRESTYKLHERTCRYLIAYFGDDLRIDKLTRADAADWRLALQEGRATASESVSEATVCQQVRNAKTIFNRALDEDLLHLNPFDRLKGTSPEPDKDWRYVSPAELEQIFEVCPTLDWQVYIGLCRLAGLRSGEALSLTWKCVDFQKARMTIYAMKTGKKRVVPIVGRVLELLVEIKARDHAGTGTGTGNVLNLSSNNLRREFHRMLKRADIEPWEDCFQVLRRNCGTDWSQQFPQHVVSTWIGHSILVSARHYLQVPEEVYERAKTM